MRKNHIDRFWSKVNKKSTEECWEWLSKARCGKSMMYGQFWLNGKSETPHRVSYEIYYGIFDKTFHVLHRCDNPICVNPTHLWLGTNHDNIKDKMRKGRWGGGHPKFIPALCPRCNRMKQIVKGYCKSCYSTVRRQKFGRSYKGRTIF